MLLNEVETASSALRKIGHFFLIQGCSLLTFDISELSVFLLLEYLLNGCKYFPNILNLIHIDDMH